jgi:methylmalonyl-CoA mutase cobalamin-binding subunit
MKKILGATIGSCIHVAGIMNFLNIAKRVGFETVFLGSAVDISELKDEIVKQVPDIVGISYRLSPESSLKLFEEFNKRIAKKFKDNTFILGTTKSVADTLENAGMLKIFDRVFTGGESCQDIENYLKGTKLKVFGGKIPPQNLLERIEYKKPCPILRHHFGRPSLEETVKGIKKISRSELIDVISIGPDQNAQEFFFKPEKMDKLQDGAGGVPVRSEEDFKKFYIASRTGNYPLMRCYSGTNDIIRFAQLLLKNINNAWCAVPLCWYNEIDNRSERKLVDAIRENQQVMKWHAERGVPVEVNESHHWSLRYASDAIAVASAYLAAYNAKKMGVRTYLSQYMFNTPPETSFTMDLAKMLAKVELIESLHDEKFYSIRQTRSGLYSMPTDFYKGKGQLASSTLLQMQLNPDIVHVVAYCESSYAAKPEDIIESSNIVLKVIDNFINGCPDMKNDESVRNRKESLIKDAKLIMEKIKSLSVHNKYEDPLIEPEIIAGAIRTGILDAPHLEGVIGVCGKLRTLFFNGANMPVDNYGNIISEEERLSKI